jgi:hypothetical protein
MVNFCTVKQNIFVVVSALLLFIFAEFLDTFHIFLLLAVTVVHFMPFDKKNYDYNTVVFQFSMFLQL